MQMPIGDILDRYSICKLKSERLNIDNKAELDCLWDEIVQYPDISDYIDKLYQINGSIWDLEADIRQGNEELLGLEEVGRRAIKIRELNGVRVQYKNEINSKLKQGFIEIKMNHGSQKEPSVVISLTTVPERLNRNDEDGLKLVLKSLCEQTESDYEVHLNVPYVTLITKKQYIIPDWIEEYKLKYPHLKIFRPVDEGPPTKILPTIRRITNPETIFIVVDDDLVYHEEMVKEHKKYQEQFKDCVICYDGRGTDLRIFGDIRDDWIYCVLKPTITHSFQHYKSVSYKRKLFKEDFFVNYVGKTFSDDVLLSSYLRNNGVEMYVAPYEPENHLFNTTELWHRNAGVTSFPVLRYASSIEGTGCNHPALLQTQEKFYYPPEFDKNKPHLIHINNKKTSKRIETDKFNHGYFSFYNPIVQNYTNCSNLLEIGVYEGDSLRLWKTIFEKAQIYGLDINDLKHLEEERISIFKADQANRDSLTTVLSSINKEFDIIIDDGGHTMKQQQISLGVLFKYLKSGGVYILEDLHTSRILDRNFIDKDDNITSLDMLEEFQKTKTISSNNLLPEEIEYLNNNIKLVEIWSRTPEKNVSVTSAIYKI